ncbi:MAG: dTDP-4-dehydrorhamnose reductase [Actinobacteria bacterium]|nr:dTDP-4-dehydrorhamnose reductase [Actinomycetota bacterium]MBU4301817.1 dTDP-4-dehydrorhamnose reductase [Actinomycetota bacterium]MBU4490792.1 dTDP-4-dehydrorhamnose reductase [Actinomycetota bacterium]MCG2794861.1 dTDP-4-dehydrorhamnose reductase [Actinomycetes bacterium]
MKILLTGSKGQLGTDFQLVSEGRHQVDGYDLDLDITDRGAVERRVADAAPDLVVNTAAFTNVDGAESDEIAAYRVNALGAQNLALGCQQAGIPLLHVSTDFVFNGDSGSPYTEFDRPDPRGVYGKSKYAGECYVAGLLNRYYICRTSWLFGVGGHNFVKTMLQAGRQRDSVRVVDDQEGSPTYSRDLASKLLEIIEGGSYGIYHLSNSGSCTWNEFTRAIFEIAGINTTVLPVSTAELGRPAPRPRYSVMRGLALEMQGIEPMRHYREATEEFIRRDLPAWEEREGQR